MVWEWKGIVGPITIRSHIVFHWKFIQLKSLPMVLHKVHYELENSIDWHFYCSDVTSFHPIDLDESPLKLLDWQMIFIESIVLLFERIGSTILWSQD